MSISYAGIIGSGTGKYTLPSVESWSSNNSILKDPHKSIMTRKIDKISDTSSLTQLTDESGDRIREVISVYPRGINPMVSVSYGNEGNNGGGNGSLVGGQNQNKQAYLPYRIMKDGSFRPPILTQYQLLPLSRLPRVTTEQLTQPCFIDFSKKIMHSEGIYREIKEKTIKTSVRPTATLNTNQQITEPFEIKYVIKNPIKFDSYAGISGIRTQDITNQEVLEPTKQIIKNPTKLNARSEISGIKTYNITNQEVVELCKQIIKNPTQFDKRAGISGIRTQDFTNQEFIEPTKGIYQNPLNIENIYPNQGSNKNIKYTDNSNLNIDSYIQEPLHTSVQAKMSSYIQVTPIEDIVDIDIKTKNAVNISYTPIKTGYTKEEHMHNDFELNNRVLHSKAFTNKNNPSIFIKQEIEHQSEQKRNMPNHKIETNYGSISRQTDLEANNREYQLKPTINSGGFEGRGLIPTTDRLDCSNKLNSSATLEKNRRDKIIMNIQNSRN
jgi:hypothetical protein